MTADSDNCSLKQKALAFEVGQSLFMTANDLYEITDAARDFPHKRAGLPHERSGFSAFKSEDLHGLRKCLMALYKFF